MLTSSKLVQVRPSHVQFCDMLLRASVMSNVAVFALAQLTKLRKQQPPLKRTQHMLQGIITSCLHA